MCVHTSASLSVCVWAYGAGSEAGGCVEKKKRGMEMQAQKRKRVEEERNATLKS